MLAVLIILMLLISRSSQECKIENDSTRRIMENSCTERTITCEGITEINSSIRKLNVTGANESSTSNVAERCPFNLTIANSSVRIIEENFTPIKYLIKLTITNSKVNLITVGAFNGLKDLKYLTLSGNNVSTLDAAAFSNFSKHLKQIDLSWNIIEDVSGDLPLGTVFRVDFNHNKLNDMKPLAVNCGKMNYLDLSFNKIGKIYPVVDCADLASLNLSGNAIKTLPKGVFNKKLRELILSYNSIGSMVEDCFDGLINLEILSLDNNDLSKINLPLGTLRPLINLKVLNLSGNSIESLILGTFAGLNKLEVLDLSRNKLKNLPDGLLQLNPISNLFLKHNRLNRLNTNVLDIGNLRVIDLDGNLWRCNDLSDILDKLAGSKRNGVHILSGSDYKLPNINGIKCFYTEKIADAIKNVTNQNFTAPIEAVQSKNIETLLEITSALDDIAKNLNEIKRTDRADVLREIDKIDGVLNGLPSAMASAIKEIYPRRNESEVDDIRKLLSSLIDEFKVDLNETKSISRSGIDVGNESNVNNVVLGVILVVLIFILLFLIVLIYFYVKQTWEKRNYNNLSRDNVLFDDF